MAMGPDREYLTRVATTAREAVEIDVGLRQYMLRVYNYMAGGVLLTGVVAYLVANNPVMLQLIYGTPLRWVILFAPLAMCFFVMPRITRMSAGAAQAVFWVFATLIGAGLAWMFLAYTGASIARTFFVTAGAFAGLSAFGYVTKRNLSAFGTFCVMGLIGLILAMIVNLFVQSAALDFAISVIGVGIFAGLTAWDTQWIKSWYVESDDALTGTRKAIVGAVHLYLDFINMFLFLLRFVGVFNSQD